VGIAADLNAQNTYIVAPSGSDTNPGTLEAPFKTLWKGVSILRPGVTLYVRGGVYKEQITITASGSASQPITVAAFPGERPILDGSYSLPGGPVGATDPRSGNTMVYAPLLGIEGSFITVRGFEVTRSHGRGIRIWPGANVTLEDNWVHDNREAGILVLGADDQHYASNHIVRNNRIWHNADLATYDRSPSTLDWPGALLIRWARNIIVEGNTVYNNWGEGILPSAADHITLRGNTVYDNYAVQIYVERTADIVIERNLLYHSNDPAFRRGGNPSPCLGFADEAQFAGTTERGANQVVVNNLIAGCSQNLFFWGGVPDAGLKNALIAYNTLVNATSNPGASPAIGINILDGSHQNVRIENNIVLQEKGQATSIETNAQLYFSNNLWSQPVDDPAKGNNDTIADPDLLEFGGITAGRLNVLNFLLGPDSPARQRAMPSPDVPTDYSGLKRSAQPDLGALEYRPLMRLFLPLISKV
jgi:parallel beta-helix repeat protein